MPRYHFRLRTHGAASLPDQGRDLPNLGAALAEAHRAARAMIRKHMTRDDLSGSLDIEDEAHQPIARILFAEVAHQSS